MAEAALFVAPARYEPFGLAILEAALSGCALILGDIASLREIWGDAALFVDPADAEALRDQMEALLFDPERAAALGRTAHRRARLYTSARMGERYLQAYASLIGRRPAPVARTSSLPATA